jgi:hypothetical protein
MQTTKLVYGLCIFTAFAIFSCNKEELSSTVDPTLPAKPTPATPDTSRPIPALRQILGVYKGTWRIYSTDNKSDPTYNHDQTIQSVLEIKRVNGDTFKLVLDGKDKAQLVFDGTLTYGYYNGGDRFLQITFGGDSVNYEYRNSEMSGSHSWYHNWGELGRWKR